jgi:hypothetical protein
MRFPNETLYFVVRFKATANRWRTSSELIPRDNQSDTNPSKFRLLFAQLAQALLFTLRNEGLCQGRPHRNPTVSTHLNSQPWFSSPMNSCYSLRAPQFPISRSHPWNGSHRNTKKSISTAKSARTPTPNCSFSLSNVLRPRFHRV